MGTSIGCRPKAIYILSIIYAIRHGNSSIVNPIAVLLSSVLWSVTMMPFALSDRKASSPSPASRAATARKLQRSASDLLSQEDAKILRSDELPNFKQLHCDWPSPASFFEAVWKLSRAKQEARCRSCPAKVKALHCGNLGTSPFQ